MHFYKTPHFIKKFMPGLVWDIPESGQNVYLTFDDGPVPGVTDWVIDLLDEFQAKATFFVVGENVRAYPRLFEQLKENGHTVGNHTFNHLNAWKSSPADYLENVKLCHYEIGNNSGNSLFRPPHGKLTRKVSAELRKKYKIIMWDVLSGDYNKKIGWRKCITNTLRFTKNGSIVVFHDSYKAEKTMKKVLPLYLKELKARGYSFKLVK